MYAVGLLVGGILFGFEMVLPHGLKYDLILVYESMLYSSTFSKYMILIITISSHIY